MKTFIAIATLVAVTSAVPQLLAGRGIVGGIGGGVAGGVVGHGVVAHGGLGLGGLRGGVIGHGVAEVYPDEISPYTFQYNVADDYSGSNFQATESDDGASNRQGSYSVALPDGRVQHVNYQTNDLDGYVAEVTYDGTAAYAPVAHAVAAPAYHAPIVAHAAPAYHAPVIAHAAP